MILYTREHVRQVERACETQGIAEDRLMENAGSAVAKVIRDRYEIENQKVLVLCGKGNNGGDGFVIARRLLQSGAKVAVALTHGEPVGETARSVYEYARSLSIRMIDAKKEPEAFDAVLAAAELIVDAVFGIGYHGPTDASDLALFDRVNACQVPVVSVDVPSGVSADDGAVDGSAIRATLTVTFFEKKVCHVVYPAVAYAGETLVAEIGAPDSAYAPSSLGMIDAESCARLLPERSPDSHKGSFGKVGLICGSYGMVGAAAIACESAVKSGVGLVKCAVSQSMYPILAIKRNEPVFAVFPDGEDRSLSGQDAARVVAALEDCDALLMGCGLGRSESVDRLVEGVLSGSRVPVVLDADGINAAAKHIDILDSAKGRLILTPHEMEMARLCRVSLKDLKENRLYYGRLISDRYQAVVVLKGSSTIVLSPDGRTFFHTGGNDGMATAGSGDMLAGILAAFAAQCDDLTDAARIGVCIHAMAGKRAAERFSRRSMTVSDMLDSLSDVYLHFE